MARVASPAGVASMVRATGAVAPVSSAQAVAAARVLTCGSCSPRTGHRAERPAVGSRRQKPLFSLKG